jgi:hypothetical protein
MAGLVPAIHVLTRFHRPWKKDVDARDRLGHDDFRVADFVLQMASVPE